MKQRVVDGIRALGELREHFDLISPTPPAAKADPEPEPAPGLKQIELGPIGKRGAADALARLEEVEERAHSRLLRAIEYGDSFRNPGVSGILPAIK
jgi:hypothetical protein